MFFYLDIIMVVSVLLVRLIIVCVMFMMWFMLVIKVSFLVGMLIVLSVVSKMIKEVSGMVVIFLDVIIRMSISVIWC